MTTRTRPAWTRIRTTALLGGLIVAGMSLASPAAHAATPSPLSERAHPDAAPFVSTANPNVDLDELEQESQYQNGSPAAPSSGTPSSDEAPYVSAAPGTKAPFVSDSPTDTLDEIEERSWQ